MHLLAKNLTAKTIDGPLLELLERDLQCWRHLVEIEAVRIVDRSVSGLSELFPLMIEDRPPLGIDPGCFLPDHDCASVDFCTRSLRFVWPPLPQNIAAQASRKRRSRNLLGGRRDAIDGTCKVRSRLRLLGVNSRLVRAPVILSPGGSFVTSHDHGPGQNIESSSLPCTGTYKVRGTVEKTKLSLLIP